MQTETQPPQALVKDILQKTTVFFREKGIESARLDAELLISSALKWQRMKLYLSYEYALTPAELTACREVVKRRSQGEPVAYILGKKDFYNHTFNVSPAVLIPRPETEQIVEDATAWLRTQFVNPAEVQALAALKTAKTASVARVPRAAPAEPVFENSAEFEEEFPDEPEAELAASAEDDAVAVDFEIAVAESAAALAAAAAEKAAESPEVVTGVPVELAADGRDKALRAALAQAPLDARIIDFGTGSGCIGLSLLAELKGAHLVAVDISADAIAVAKKNAEQLGLIERAKFICSDIVALEKANVAAHFGGRLADAIVANPPYIADGDPAVEANVKRFEPSMALFSGVDGLVHVRAWATKAAELSRAGAFIMFEIGHEQGPAALEIFEATRQFHDIHVVKDMSGRERFIRASRA